MQDPVSLLSWIGTGSRDLSCSLWSECICVDTQQVTLRYVLLTQLCSGNTGDTEYSSQLPLPMRNRSIPCTEIQKPKSITCEKGSSFKPVKGLLVLSIHTATLKRPLFHLLFNVSRILEDFFYRSEITPLPYTEICGKCHWYVFRRGWLIYGGVETLHFMNQMLLC